MVGISDGFSSDRLNDFLITHSITFTTLVDTTDLDVTSHYGIGFWSQFWMLDRHGNRIGDQPLSFDRPVAEQLLNHLTSSEPPARPWDLSYLADR